MKRLISLVFLALLVACKTIPLQMPDEPWRSDAPGPGPAPTAINLPDIKKLKLANGLTVMVVEDHNLPIVAARLVVRAGSSEDGKSYGLAQLTADMLDEGAGDLDTVAFSQAFSDIGTQVVVGSSADASVIAAPVMSQHLPRAVELFSWMVQKPRFAKEDFERTKIKHLSTLKARSASPDALASDRFLLDAYGNDHPYGHPASGEEDSVKKIDLNDVKQFWARHYGPTNTAFIVSGDITTDQAQKLAETYFGQWKTTVKEPQKIAAPKADGISTVSLIAREHSPQTVLLVGRPVLRAGDPMEASVAIYSEILGGMFSSRLNSNLRETKAWTYGVHSSLDALAGPGPFSIQGAIQVPYGGPALAEIMEELNSLAKDGVEEDELVQAKKSILLSAPGRFETVGALSAQATQLYVYDLPLDYFQNWLARVEQVSLEDVKKAANLVGGPKKKFAIVAVGELSAMQKPIEELKLGKIKVQKN